MNTHRPEQPPDWLKRWIDHAENELKLLEDDDPDAQDRTAFLNLTVISVVAILAVMLAWAILA